ncbi:hypothetical protein E2320_005017 [Naja naja]|nr:hypothetical protein E2320_005017 [Naja naja]
MGHHNKIPDWFLNRLKDRKDGKYSQVLPNGLDDNKLCKNLEVPEDQGPQGLCHFWGLHMAYIGYVESLPSRWYGACVLFFLLSIQQGDRLGIPIYVEANHISMSGLQKE